MRLPWSTKRKDEPELLVWPSNWFNLAANTASIVGLVLVGFAAFSWDVSAIPVVYLCLLSLALLVRYLRQERWARYARAMTVLRRAYQHLDDAVEYSVFSPSDQACESSLREALNSLAEAFTLVTGTSCRVCIAATQLEGGPSATESGDQRDPGQLFNVRVIMRSGERRRSEEVHRIDRNSDFLRVFEENRPFFENDLVVAWRAHEYENSKWTKEKVEKGDIDYRSAMVFPVEQPAPRDTDTGDHPPPRVIAFLCVDASRPRAFDRHADIGMGSCFAHALYPVLRPYLMSNGSIQGGYVAS